MNEIFKNRLFQIINENVGVEEEEDLLESDETKEKLFELLENYITGCRESSIPIDYKTSDYWKDSWVGDILQEFNLSTKEIRDNNYDTEKYLAKVIKAYIDSNAHFVGGFRNVEGLYTILNKYYKGSNATRKVFEGTDYHAPDGDLLLHSYIYGGERLANWVKYCPVIKEKGSIINSIEEYLKSSIGNLNKTEGTTLIISGVEVPVQVLQDEMEMIGKFIRLNIKSALLNRNLGLPIEKNIPIFIITYGNYQTSMERAINNIANISDFTLITKNALIQFYGEGVRECKLHILS